ncbi:MAG: hypothetical protein ACXVBE_05390 [Bdellovibrionota bacterium]
MRKSSLLILLLATISTPAFSHMKKEAKGGCTKYKQTLEKEFAAWKQPSTTPEGFDLPVGKRVKFHLLPESSIVLPVEPQIVYPSHTFVTDLVLSVPKSGTYRVSLGAHIWLGLSLESSKEIEPSHIEMQGNCGAIKKFVEFPLIAGTRYFLHVSDSKKDTQELLLTETGK